MSDQKTKVVVVTGAGRGIGRGVALEFAKQGALVATADVDAAAASEVAKQIDTDGGRATAYGLDVADGSSVAQCTEQIVAAFGQIDVLVHCAAVNRLMPFLETPASEWRRIIDTNLTGTFLIAKSVATHMVAQQRGRIILIASNVGFRGAIDRAAYAASKAGVINLMQTMAIELAEHHITVNAIAPGPTETPMTAWQPANMRRALCNDVPMKRYGEIHEIAAGALFLASDAASYITAHTLAIDGGFTGAGIIHRTASA